MKKSVRIRKAGPGEKPGYYNKTAKFLYGGLVKANMGMQVGNNPQEIMQSIMKDTYASLRDGMDPNMVFEDLVVNKNLEQQVAFQIMDVVMKKLAENNLANPDYLDDEDDAENTGGQPGQQPTAPTDDPTGNPVGTPGEEEDLAMSMAEEDTDEGAMARLNESAPVEEEQQQQAFGYGGPFTRRLKRAEQGMEQPSEEEMMMMQQQQGQQQPQQQEGGQDQMQQIMQQVGQALQQGSKPEEIIAQLLQGQIPPEVIMQIFVEFGMPQEQIGQVIQSVIQQSQGGQEPMMQYGGYFNDGGEAEDYYNMYENDMSNKMSPEDQVINQYGNPGELSNEQSVPFSLERLMEFTPGVQSYERAPDIATYLNAYPYHNVADENIPNDLLPMSQAKFGGYLPKAKLGRVAKTPTSTPPPPPPPKRGRPKKQTTVTPLGPTVTVEPQQVSGMSPDVLQRFQNYFNSRNPLSERSGAGKFTEGVGTVLNTIRPQNWTENWRSKVAPSTTATMTLDEINKIIADTNYKSEVLQPNVDGTYNSGLALSMGSELATTLLTMAEEKGIMAGLKKGSPVTLEVPTSKVPELNFLSLHNEKNKTQIRLTMDVGNKIKAELITDVKTKLKGFDKNNVVIKDEFLIDPKAKQIIDFKTGMPLEMIQKSYYSGNQLNFWNNAKMSADRLAEFPKVISTEPLKTKPATGWNKFYNLGVKPTFLGPLAAFGYPGFKQRSQFSPNPNKITADFLGRQREIGPQSPGGMTFGDQPIGTQFADYNLQRDRNFKTGRNFMTGAGILGAGAGLGYLYYNRDTKDFLQDNPEGAPLQNINVNDPTKKPGFGFSFNPNWGKTSSKYNIENNYGLDSMNVNNDDTINDKGWGELAPNYKHGGAHKKKFLKRMLSTYAPGGEAAQDTSLGRGNRMDSNNIVGKKIPSFVAKMSEQSNKEASSELYKMVQKSGDPKLMSIFSGDDQSNQGMQQPMSNNQMAEGGEPCPPGTHWDELIQDCVEDVITPVNPTREQIFNDPEYRENLDKLEYRRDVNDYRDWRGNEFYKNTPKKIVKPGDEGYPSNGIGEPMEMLDRESQDPQYLEWKNQFKQEHPNPQNPGWQMPYNAIPNQEHYPQIGPWNNEDQYYYDEFFNPDTKGDSENYDEQGNQKGKGRTLQTPVELKNQMQKRSDEWCPCSKRKPIYVQGKQVMQEVCVPCEEAEEGGFVNMDMGNPLTRFIYGGDDEAPDYYEPYDLPEAKNGMVMSKESPLDPYHWFLDQTSPDNWPGAYPGNEPGDKELSYTLDATGNKIYDPAEEAAYDKWSEDYFSDDAKAGSQRYQDYQNYLSFYNSVGEDDEIDPKIISPNTGVITSKGTNCGPGTVWSPTYNQCIPVASVRYNERMVRRAPGLLNTLGLWGNGRSPYERILQANYLGSNMPYRGNLNSLGRPVATFKKNWLAPKLRIYDPNGNYGKEELDQIISSYYGGKGGPKSKKEKSNTKSKKEESKKEKSEKGPSEVKFSSAAMKYRVNRVVKPYINDFYKNIGKKVIKAVTKNK